MSLEEIWRTYLSVVFVVAVQHEVQILEEIDAWG
jgi:hypothetical protein